MNLKKFSCILICAAVMFGTIGFFTSAAGGSEGVSVNGVTAYTGDTVKVSLSLADLKNPISGYCGSISYNGDVLEVLEVSDTFGNTQVNPDKDKMVTFACAEGINGMDFSSKTEIINIEFKVKETDVKEVELTYEFAQIYEFDQANLTDTPIKDSSKNSTMQITILSNTDLQTQVPDGSNGPESTVESDGSIGPDVSKEAEASKEPEVSMNPDGSEGPKESKEATPTADVKQTKAPMVTKSAVTAKPPKDSVTNNTTSSASPSKSPVVTKAAKVTDAPAVTMAPTVESTVTVAPSQDQSGAGSDNGTDSSNNSSGGESQSGNNSDGSDSGANDGSQTTVAPMVTEDPASAPSVVVNDQGDVVEDNTDSGASLDSSVNTGDKSNLKSMILMGIASLLGCGGVGGLIVSAKKY